MMKKLLFIPLMFALCACGHSPSEDDKQKPSEESEVNMKLSIIIRTLMLLGKITILLKP